MAQSELGLPPPRWAAHPNTRSPSRVTARAEASAAKPTAWIAMPPPTAPAVESMMVVLTTAADDGDAFLSVFSNRITDGRDTHRQTRRQTHHLITTHYNTQTDTRQITTAHPAARKMAPPLTVADEDEITASSTRIAPEVTAA